MKIWKIVAEIFSITLCLLMVAPVWSYYHARSRMLNLPDSIFYDDWSTLLRSGFGRYKIIDYINNRTSRDSTILVFRQNDFALYAKRRFIRHLDPRMIPVFQTGDKYKAAQLMREMGIDYIFIPSYLTPTYTDTCIHSVIADTSLCDLIVESDGAKLYRLSPSPANPMPDAKTNVIDKEGLTWTIFEDNKNFTTLRLQKGDDIHFRPRVRTSFLFSGSSNVWDYPVGEKEGVRLDPGVYEVQAECNGTGWICLFLVEHFDTNRRKLIKLWESSMSGPRHIANQFHLAEEARDVRIIFVINSYTDFTLKQMKIRRKGSGNTPLNTKTIPHRPWSGVAEDLHIKYDSNSTSTFSWKRRANQIIYSGDGHWILPASFYKGKFQPGHVSPFPRAFKVSFDISGHGSGQLFCIAYQNSFPHNTPIDSIAAESEKPQRLEYLLIFPDKINEFRLGITFPKRQALSMIKDSLRKMLGSHIGLDSMQMENGPWEISLSPLHIERIPDWKNNPDIINCLEKYAANNDEWAKNLAVCRPGQKRAEHEHRITTYP